MNKDIQFGLDSCCDLFTCITRDGMASEGVAVGDEEESEDR